MHFCLPWLYIFNFCLQKITVDVRWLRTNHSKFDVTNTKRNSSSLRYIKNNIKNCDIVVSDEYIVKQISKQEIETY